MDELRLAVSLQNGDHLVEIWDTQTREVSRPLVPLERLSEEPGYRLIRNTRMAWDPERERLHTLDGFTGAYRAFHLNGSQVEPLFEAQIDDLHREKYEGWIAETNQQMIDQRQYLAASFSRFGVTLDDDGNAWMVEHCDRTGEPAQSRAGTAHLLVVDTQGSGHRLTQQTSCCSLEAVPWDEELVFAAPPVAGRVGCFDIVERPTLQKDEPETSWLEVTPLSPGPHSRSRQGNYTPPIFQRLGESDALSLLDLDAGLILVCAGGNDRALDCSERWFDPETTEPIDLLPPPKAGRPVTGRVTVESEPIARATISLVPEPLRTVRRFVLPLTLQPDTPSPTREVRTDDTGHFALPPLAPGSYRLVLALPDGRMDQGTVFEVGSPRPDPSGEIAPLDLGTLEFPRGLEIEVLVTDLEGLPIPAARTGVAQETSPNQIAEFQATTGADGRAQIHGLATAGRGVVTCSAHGHDSHRQPFDSPPSFVTCPLARLGQLEARIVDEDHEPLPGVRVELRGGSAWFAGSVEATASDDDGRVSFTVPEAGSFEVLVSHPGRETVRRSVTFDRGESRDLGDLVLEPGTVWRMRVVDTANGEPVVGASLAPLEPSSAFQATVTDEQGEVEIEGPSRGTLKVEAHAEGFATHHVELPEASRSLEAEPHEIALEPGGWVVARVWDEDTGAPCVGCRVSLTGPGPAEPLVTDGSGTARSEPLSPGLWRASPVRLRGMGSVVTQSGGDDSRSVTVAARETTEVRFGEPRETLEVMLSPPPGDGWRLSVEDTAGAARLHPLDASGAATIARPEGGAVLALSGPGVTVDLGTLAEDADDPTLIEPATGRLIGRIPPTVGDGGGSLWLELWNLGAGHRAAGVWAAPGGSFTIPFLATGTYEVRSRDGSLGVVSVLDGEETIFEPAEP